MAKPMSQIYKAILLANILLVPASCAFGEDRVAYCDMMRHPQEYDGKTVTVTGTYRVGYEWSELYCLGCLDTGSTWVEMDESAPNRSFRKLNWNVNKEMGRTFNVVFVGVFHSTGGRFGHMNGYDFKFVVRSVVKAQLVAKDSWHPKSLPPEMRGKVCSDTLSNRDK